MQLREIQISFIYSRLFKNKKGPVKPALAIVAYAASLTLVRFRESVIF